MNREELRKEFERIDKLLEYTDFKSNKKLDALMEYLTYEEPRVRCTCKDCEAE